MPLLGCWSFIVSPEGFTGLSWSFGGSLWVGRKMRLGFMGPILHIPYNIKQRRQIRIGSIVGRKDDGVWNNIMMMKGNIDDKKYSTSSIFS